MSSGAANSDFCRWMIRRFRDAFDHDPMGIDIGTGEPVAKVFVIWAALTLMGDLEPAQEAHLARVFDVTLEQLRAAYAPEMRPRVTASLLAHPDLAAWDSEVGDAQ